MHWHNIMSKTIHQIIRMDKEMMVDDMSAGTTINAQAMEEEVDSLGIVTHACVDPSSASHVINKVTGMQTVHTRMGLISNSIPTAE